MPPEILVEVYFEDVDELGALKGSINTRRENAPGVSLRIRLDPDCRAEFFSAFESLVRCGLRPDTNMAIRTPLLEMEKGDIVRRGIALGAPLHLTWSCYRNGERPCNTCLSCALRRRGFEAACKAAHLLNRCRAEECFKIL